MSEEWNQQGRTAAGAVKRGAEATANGIHNATSFVARNDGRVADGAQVLTQVIGGGLDKVGGSIASAGQQASRTLHSNATRLADAAQQTIRGTGPTSAMRKGAGFVAWVVTKAVTHAVGVTANALTLVGQAAASQAASQSDQPPL